MEEEARIAIKAELESERAGLCHGDRRLLKCFYGLIGLEGVRKATRKKHEMCAFVRKCLYESNDNVEIDENEEKNNVSDRAMSNIQDGNNIFESDFNVEKELDPRIMNFPSIFDNTGIKAFLAEDGLSLNQRECAAILKSFQVLMKKRQ